MEIVEFGRLTAGQRAALEGDEHDPFDAAGATLRYRPKDRHVALEDGTGRLIASTGMLVLEVRVADQSFPVVGLGGVIVNQHHRGQGLARRVVQAALAHARALGPEFAILFCLESRAGLYHRLGFTEVTEPVTVEQPGGPQAMPDHTMWHPLRPAAHWPPGPIAVLSLPF